MQNALYRAVTDTESAQVNIAVYIPVSKAAATV
jgi:hypothetical protein